MRVPYPLVVVLCLGLVGGLWWLRTRKMDFMSSRGTSKPLATFIAPAGDESRPQLLPDPVSRPATSGDEANRNGREDPDTLGLGDMETAPGLGEYSELGSQGAEHLMTVAKELEERGNFQRALLAWERVLDSCEPTAEQRTAAGDSIQRIRPTLPRWNIDPTGEFPLLLQLGTTRTRDEALAPETAAVAEFLHRDSSDLVAITPRITTSQVDGAPEQAPIALYFSGTDEGENNQSSLVSINPPLGDREALRQSMLAALYELIRNHVAGLDTLTPPGEAGHPEDPELDFERQFTRLHWQYFARSLAQLPRPLESPVDTAPADLEEEGESEDPD